MGPKTLHSNNFDFLRIFFALLVLVTHSYPLSGAGRLDFFASITGTEYMLSYIGVRGFFVISGYLIFQSLLRSKNLVDYFWKRVLRLFPGLMVVLLLSVMLGVFVYVGTPGKYFTQASTYTYFPKNLSLYKLQYGIDGVFANNPFKYAINGSLWTLAYEFTCYGALAVLFFVKGNQQLLRWSLAAACAFLLIGSLFFKSTLEQFSILLSFGELANLGTFFISGSLLAAVDFQKFKYRQWIWPVALLAMIAAFYFSLFHVLQFLVFPLFVIPFGLEKYRYISSVSSTTGDLSYGLYIYGFPVQQTLEHYFRLNQLPLFFWSLIVTLILSYFSWHLVEKRALLLKKFHPKFFLEYLARKFSVS